MAPYSGTYMGGFALFEVLEIGEDEHKNLRPEVDCLASCRQPALVYNGVAKADRLVFQSLRSPPPLIQVEKNERTKLPFCLVGDYLPSLVKLLL